MGLIDSLISTFSFKENSSAAVVNSEDLNKVADSNQKHNDNVESTAASASSIKNISSNKLKNKENTKMSNTTTKTKMKIYNLVIIDESGSMSHLTESTISGVNEVINTIKSAQNEFSDSQEHFLTIVTFDSPGRNNQSVRYIIDGLPISDVTKFDAYAPNGCTPLYDAMGMSLTRIHKNIKGDTHCIGSVTVVTDGLENASRIWNASKLRNLINQLKEEGWTFSYMGSAHNVKDVTDLLSIDNYVEFSHDDMGNKSSWGRERSAKHEYFRRVAREMDFNGDIDDYQFAIRKKELASRYYEDRVTPSYIDWLEDNQVFVFGSNPEGIHNGGAAYVALKKFGAEYGNGEGLQGQSYAIPSTGNMAEFSAAVHRFIEFARNTPDSHYFVTRVGCGSAGWNVSDVAPLFADCVNLENVSLPEDFWCYLGLKMHNKPL